MKNQFYSPPKTKHNYKMAKRHITWTDRTLVIENWQTSTSPRSQEQATAPEHSATE